jgi:hypothetical protein
MPDKQGARVQEGRHSAEDQEQPDQEHQGAHIWSPGFTVADIGWRLPKVPRENMDLTPYIVNCQQVPAHL